MSDVDTLAELEAAMALPGYEPILAKPVVIAMTLGVSKQAVTNWASAARTAQTGVRRYGALYDFNECLRWVLKRDEQQASRRAVSA